MYRSFLAGSATLALTATSALADERANVLSNYADIALAGYSDSLVTAQALQAAIDALVAAPSVETLDAARTAWIASRVPYQQTEVFRFGNPIVDDWEGKVNAWPLDEGLMDYVDAAYGGPTDENEFAALNVIANPTFSIAGLDVDATVIDADLIGDVLNEADGIETNVARGYHAIEFLLWGQDLNGTDAGAGDRPYTDFVQGEGCTGGNCDRRVDYLTAATDLLISDLEFIIDQWDEDGEARTGLIADPDAGIVAMITGMGSLSYGEQAGQRMRLGLMLNDPEEEHDCFSDNTHNSHYYDGKGVQNVYLGRYERIDGTVIEGPGLTALVAAVDPSLDDEVRVKLATTMGALTAIVTAAENGMAYDQMLDRQNTEGEALIMAGVNGLIDQTRSFEKIVGALSLHNVAFEGSDSLDDPNAVFQ
jgi:putative iron-regulated protein